MHPFLDHFHGANPGVTSRVFVRGRCPDGRSSYDRLVDAVRPGDRVLDLCCGDGHLLAALLDRAASAVGVDASAAELEAARRRLAVPLAEGRVVLHRAEAQALPLADASVDLVVSHLAFMLLDPVEPAVAEMRRVLRPGGRFRAVVGGGLAAPDDAWARFVARLDGYPELAGALRIGDGRTSTAEGLRQLLPDAVVETFPLRLDGSPAEVEDALMTCYDVDLLDPARRAALLTDTRADLHTHAVDGVVACRMHLMEVGWG